LINLLTINLSQELPKITIIGGITQDIGGKSKNKLVAGDKNIGSTKFSFGGVAFNIARNLALVGVNLEFVSAVGNDHLKENLNSELVKYPQIHLYFYESKTNSSSTYLYILNSDSKMEVALSDFELMDEFPVEYLKNYLSKTSLGNNLDNVLVVDTNLSQVCLEYLMNSWEGPIFCDPVSVAKSNKLLKKEQKLEILSKIFLLKPNDLEFQNLCEQLGLVKSDQSKFPSKFIITQDLVENFLALTQIPNLVITQSDGPVIYTSYDIDAGKVESFGIIEPKNPPAKNPTGAGDAMMAGLVLGYSSNQKSQKLIDWVKLGLAFSSLAIESDDIINDKINKEVISERIKKFQ